MSRTVRGKNAMIPPGMISTTVAAKVSGLPGFALRDWANKGILSPTPLLGEGKGRVRNVVEFEDMVAARAVIALHEAGAGLQPICRAVEPITRAGDSITTSRLWWSGENEVGCSRHAIIRCASLGRSLAGSALSATRSPSARWRSRPSARQGDRVTT